MSRQSRNLIFSILLILGTLILSEGTLGLLSLISPNVAALLSRAQVDQVMQVTETVEDEKLGWRPNPKYPGHDRHGFRDKFVPDEVSIVALGDSQTYGTGVAPDQAWPQQLEMLADIPTYNMAYGGYGPTHSLLLLKEAMALKPKLIIEAFYAGNDLYDSYAHVYDMKQLPDLHTTDEQVIQAIIDAENQEPLAEHISQIEIGMGPSVPSHTPTHGGLREFLAEHSKLYGLLRAVKIVMNKHTKYDSNMVNNLDWESLKQKVSGKEYDQIFDNGQLRTVFTPDYRLHALDLNDPRIREGHRISLEAIQLMEKQAHAASVEFIVLLIPTKELVFKDVVDENMTNPPKAYQSLVINEELMWQKTEDFLRDRRIYFVDSLPTLRHCLRSGNQPYPISLDGHPNAIGHQAIAEVIRFEIKEHSLLR